MRKALQRLSGKLFMALMVGLFGVALVVTGSYTVAHAQEEVSSNTAAVNAPPNDADIEAGKQVYFKKCVWCHGEKGAGDGPSADRLWPRPRSFVEGTFKIRHTDSGELPTDQDLFLTVTHGLPGSAMPAWEDVLSEKERRQVIQFVKYRLVEDVDFTDPDEEFNLITVGEPPPATEESLKRGDEVFRVKGKCLECHGEEGRGDGNASQKDEWGFPIFPADLRKCWNFRGNREDPYNASNVFREVSTGLDGTPMPSFADVLTVEERWDVANFVMSICERKNDGSPLSIDPLNDHPTIRFVVKSYMAAEGGEIPATPDDPQWQEQERTYIGLAGQITHKPRNFVRLVDDLWVRSIYNENEIAYLIEWDDRNKSIGTPEVMAQVSQIRETPPSGDPIAYKYASFVTNDAIGISFAAQWATLTAPEKPRFIFGDKKNHLDIWKWDADGSVGEYIGEGWDKALKKRNAKNVKVPFAQHKNGRWQVIMVRSLETEDKENDVQLVPGNYIPMVFYAWDGHNGDYGLKMSISTFYYAFLIPPVPSSVFYLPILAVVLVLVTEGWILKKIKQAKSSKK